MTMREPPIELISRPQPVALAGRRVLVLGLGETGLALARWIGRQGAEPAVADTRSSPPRAAQLAAQVPGAALHAGPFDAQLLRGIDLLALSPGLAPSEPLVQRALAEGIPVAGEMELFAWHVRAHQDARVVAITGTNGKTTVTALTGALLRAARIDCEVAGNIGPSALDALMRRLDEGTAPAVWVLELSSYQLETTWSLNPEAAAVLNVSEDHLDRYRGLEEYAAAKARIFFGDGVQVLNRGDAHAAAMALPGRRRTTFGLDAPPGEEDFGLLGPGADPWLAQGANRFFELRSLQLHGAHNVANALAACALARLAGAPYRSLAEGLQRFRGLAHRLQRVAVRAGVTWFDDSKGTNVGATLAALEGLGALAAREPVPGKTLLILGGEGKGQDFSPLRGAAEKYAARILLIGRDAPLVHAALAQSGVPLERCASLEEAVRSAARHARPGDRVLLSPACASFDMFRDYRHRGESFVAAIRALGA